MWQLVLLLGLLSPSSSLPGDRELGSTVDPDGTTRTYRVSYATLDRSPAWSPAAGAPPLSWAEALEAGKRWLRTENPEFTDFRCEQFNLRRVEERAGEERWIWDLSFEPKLKDRWLPVPDLEVYLLMDSTVIEPTVDTAKAPH